MFKIIIFLSLFLNIQIAYADYKSCTEVDIRTKNPNLKDFLSTPRNQDSIGWCYAFSAADLLSVHLGRPVSALHMSAIFNNAIAQVDSKDKAYRINVSFNDIYEAGRTHMALNSAMKEAFICSEKAMPFDMQHEKDIYKLIKTIESLKEKMKQPQLKDQVDCENCKDILKITSDPIFKNANFSEIQTLLASNELNISLKNFIDKSCKERIKVAKFKLVMIPKPTEKTKVEYFKKVNDALDFGKPISISYYLNFVTKEKGSHSNSIIGRRWKNNKCEYNIKNSWGKSCASYLKGIDCNLREGSFWVNEDKMYEMLNNDSLTTTS